MQNTEPHFESWWTSRIIPDTPTDIVALWRESEFSAFERGLVVLDAVKPHLSIDGKRTLDIGCGYAGESIALCKAGAIATGIDIEYFRVQGAMVRLRYDHPGTRLSLSQSTGESLPFKDSAFDFVLCNDVLEHVAKKRLVLCEISRILKPGGWLYLQFPNRFSPWNFLKDPHYNLFGISILPRYLGAFYVTKIRKRAKRYNVSSFPVASWIRSVLSSIAIDVIDWQPRPTGNYGFLKPLIYLYRLNTKPVIIFICQKRAITQ